jgi:4-hydroxy-tetrahydrodipicolinate synthase
VIAGVSAGTPAAAIGLAADAADAGAEGIMLLPPLGYRADEREIEAFYRAVAEAAGLPLMAYNNPEASGTDMGPALIARLGRRIERLVAVKECSGDVRRIPAIIHAAPDLDVLVGGDDWALEGFAAGAIGWVTGVADVAPRECVELFDLCRAGDLEAARAVYRRLLPLARFDMTPKLVQYFKAAMDAVGLAGGSVRPPRLELTDAEYASSAPRLRCCGRNSWREGRALLRGRRLAHGGHAGARDHRRGRPDPGSSMLERKLYFEREMDDLRLLLMREPRGHGAMSGSILQPPTRPDADWGVLFIEVSGCLPMCGHGTMGIATVLVETGMVRVTEPETVVRLEVPAGLIEARVPVQGRPRALRDAAQRPGVLRRASTVASRCRGSARWPTTSPTAATSSRSSTRLVGWSRRRSTRPR